MVADVGDAGFLARLPERVVHGAESVDGHVKLPAELAGEADSQRSHALDSGHGDLACR